MEAGLALRRVVVVGVIILLEVLAGGAIAGEEAEGIVAGGQDAFGVEVGVEVRMAPSPSIHIQGDEEFEEHPAVRSGSGTSEDPYVISNWTIQPTGPVSLLVEDTRAHVVIETILIPQSQITAFPVALAQCQEPVFAECMNPRGISLVNTTNVVVEEVHTGSNQRGIVVVDSSDVRIDTVRVGPDVPAGFTAVPRGIQVSGSTGVEIANATVTSSSAPIIVGSGSEDVTVRDSTTIGVGSSVLATEVQDSDGVEFVRTVFDGHGLFLRGDWVGNVSLVYSEVRNPSEDIRDSVMEEMGTFRMCGNTVSGFETRLSYGVQILFQESVEFVGNKMVNNTAGVWLSTQNPVQVEHNVFYNTTQENRAALNLFGHGSQVLWNSFENASQPHEVSAAASIGGESVNASLNWWGDASGPDVNGTGPGTGEFVFAQDSEELVIDPWLEKAPAAGPDAVDCGVPQGEPGAKQTPSFNASVAVNVTGEVSVSEKVGPERVAGEKMGPQHLKAEAKLEASAKVGPFPLPT